jgi:hypothetical protein
LKSTPKKQGQPVERLFGPAEFFSEPRFGRLEPKKSLPCESHFSSNRLLSDILASAADGKTAED